jgi:hypothetical protein
MRLYADRPEHRTRQLAADLGLLAWAALWVLVALGHDGLRGWRSRGHPGGR